ncbi:MAG: formylglycine-generating enzyme family protein [Gemmatimonadales bacterium]|nr:formylglycine-generating enzyme family protein [Gemmatimonadales bacterium]
MTKNFSLLLSAILLLAVVMGGCSSDEADPLTPEVGIVVIDCAPDDIELTWELSGPDLVMNAGSGDHSLHDMESGEYTISWGTKAGWLAPPTESRTLALGKMITFVGEYREYGGCVVINPDPDNIPVTWELAGPDGYFNTGSGDQTLCGLEEGNYSLEWSDVPDWAKPNPYLTTGSLASGDTLTFYGRYKADFVRISAGTFSMGSPATEPGREPDETQHPVTLTHDFFLQTTEKTNGQYIESLQWAYDQDPALVTVTSEGVFDAMDGSTVRLLDLAEEDCQIEFSGGLFSTNYPNRPIFGVTWWGAAAYCDWRSLQEGIERAYDHDTWACNEWDVFGAKGYRLPTEAEWEYACRAGSETAFGNGEITNLYCADPLLDEIGWYCGNAEGATQDVENFPANVWGLHDMHGNLYEWCNDWYGSYPETAIDPVGPVTNLTGLPNRVSRGGGWNHGALFCRSGSRTYNLPSNIYFNGGFRLARTAD